MSPQSHRPSSSHQSSLRSSVVYSDAPMSSSPVSSHSGNGERGHVESPSPKRRQTSSRNHHHRSPRKSLSQSSSHYRSRSPGSSSAPPSGWLDELVNLKVENRRLKAKIAKLSRRHDTSPMTSPRRGDVKPHISSKHRRHKAALAPHVPTQDDLDYLLGIAEQDADAQAIIYWDVLREPVVRESGYSPALWKTMTEHENYNNVSFPFSDVPAHCLKPDGTSMRGGNNMCAAYTRVHHIAAGVMDVLYVNGPLPQQQPHLDLMGLMFEHLIDASRNSAPGLRKTKEISNKHTPPTYILPGRLATAMVVRYMTYHKEKHRKARINRLELAEAMRATGRRPPRKSAPKVAKPNAAYDRLRAIQTNASASQSPPVIVCSSEGLPERVKMGLPPSPVPHGQPPYHSKATTNDPPAPKLFIASPASVPEIIAKDKDCPSGASSRPLDAREPVLDATVDVDDFDEDAQDYFEASKSGGVAIPRSPPKPKNKKGKKTADTSTGDAPDKVAVPRPPNYSPSDKPKAKPLSKAEKAKATAAKSLATRKLNVSLAEKSVTQIIVRRETDTIFYPQAAKSLNSKSSAAQEGECSTDDEGSDASAHRKRKKGSKDRKHRQGSETTVDDGDLTDDDQSSRKKGRTGPGESKGSQSQSRAPRASKGEASATSKRQRAAQVPANSPTAAGRKMKRQRTHEGLNAPEGAEDETRRTSKRNQGAVGEGTGEFDDAYWGGVEKSQKKIDAWCERLEIDQVFELHGQHGRGLMLAHQHREYITELCKAEQFRHQKQLDARYDAKAKAKE